MSDSKPFDPISIGNYQIKFEGIELPDAVVGITEVIVMPDGSLQPLCFNFCSEKGSKTESKLLEAVKQNEKFTTRIATFNVEGDVENTFILTDCSIEQLVFAPHDATSNEAAIHQLIVKPEKVNIE